MKLPIYPGDLRIISLGMEKIAVVKWYEFRNVLDKTEERHSVK